MDPRASVSASPIASGVALSFPGQLGATAASPASNHEITPTIGQLVAFTYAGKEIEMRYITKYLPLDGQDYYLAGITVPQDIYKEFQYSRVRDIQIITEDTPISAARLELLKGYARNLARNQLALDASADHTSPRFNSPPTEPQDQASTQSAAASASPTPISNPQSARGAKSSNQEAGCCEKCFDICTIM